MYTYATSPVDVAVDKATGKPAAGIQFRIFTDRDGQQITAGLRDLDGRVLPGVVISDEDGRWPFTDDAERPHALWAVTPGGDWYRLVANELADASGDILSQFPAVQAAASEAKDVSVEALTTANAARRAADGKVDVTDLVPLPAQVRFKRDTLSPFNDHSPWEVTLGAVPLPDSETVTLNGTPTDDYNLAGNTLSVDQVVEGDMLTIRYAARSVTPIPDATRPPEPVLITDSFDRADDSSNLGSTDTGQTWVNPDGRFGIVDNQIYLANPSGGVGTGDIAYVDCGSPAYTVDLRLSYANEAQIRALAPSVNIIDPDNCIVPLLTRLYIRTGGATSTVGPAYSQTFVTGDTMRIAKEGNQLSVWRQAGSTGDFVQVLGPQNVTQGADSTRVGVWGRTQDSLRADDFRVMADG